MRILVTGAEGQLGHALRRMAAAGDWLFTDLPQLDITDREAVGTFFDRERPNAVVNCAAFTDVDRAETERDAAFRVNRDAPRFLAEACERTGAAIVHISTDFVFNGSATVPYTEEDAPAPLNVYGESKLAGERAVFEAGCRGAVVRTSWLYSLWGKNFVKAILGAAAQKPEIRVVADQTGCPTSALSLAAAVVAMIQKLAADPGAAGLYHFCDAGVATATANYASLSKSESFKSMADKRGLAGTAVSRAGFAAEIIRQAGLECRVVPVPSSEYPSPAARPQYSALDTAKITRTFGIVPPPWQEALAECIDELKNGC